MVALLLSFALAGVPAPAEGFAADLERAVQCATPAKMCVAVEKSHSRLRGADLTGAASDSAQLLPVPPALLFGGTLADEPGPAAARFASSISERGPPRGS